MAAEKTVYEKLFTHEDVMNIHKTLGVLSVISALVRIQYVGVEHDMGFKTWPEWTLATIVLHLAAVVSSLVFKIPSKRIKQGNRLWPQARLHNIVFCSRHMAFVGLYWAEQVFGWEEAYWRNYAILIAGMLAADAVTASVKEKSSTIRDLNAHPAAKYFFSMSQFGAAAYCLFGLRRSSGHFYTVVLIQLTAFMTTLRRKNLESHELGVFLYGVLIVGGILIGGIDVIVFGSMHVFYLSTATGRIVHLIRVGGPAWMGPLKSKYVLWTLAAVALHYIRPIGPNPHPFALWLAEEPQAGYVQKFSSGLFAVMLCHAYFTTKRQLPAYHAANKVE